MAGMAAVVCFASAGCAVSKKTAVRPPQGAPQALQTASEAQLIARYNILAGAVHSLNASVEMKLTAGSAYSGVIEQYHEVNGFILAERPASIRVIGQAPVVAKDVFDMVSDGETFHVFIPSKNKFIEGPASFERESAKPIENLRPQHLVDALFWTPIAEGQPVLFEEAEEDSRSYYALSVARNTAQGGAAAANWEIARKIWFERGALSVSRVETYGSGGKVSSDVRYADWQPAGGADFARQITIARPGEGYTLALTITKLTLNQPIPAGRFVLRQPAGSELVRVGPDVGRERQ